ncbi:hypothetical protein RC55_02335 [Herbaspirillum seropedicae]|nr:hypothetical protein ACP92_17515 [Herbaspirillum seropedicae]NQE28115.1 hypothetical protein [Herbaspirillum seropedicae]
MPRETRISILIVNQSPDISARKKNCRASVWSHRQDITATIPKKDILERQPQPMGHAFKLPPATRMPLPHQRFHVRKLVAIAPAHDLMPGGTMDEVLMYGLSAIFS